ncbi:hypothetical protein ABZW10_36375 [Kitasatospora sp. NPDC004723]|uniref:hypothetical protein n=1 Tax=Kitasatospora sp. NPDC004723 TaxID=3154288 RepID=UPI0033A3580F
MPDHPADRIEAAVAALARCTHDVLAAALDHPLPPACATSVQKNLAALHGLLRRNAPAPAAEGSGPPCIWCGKPVPRTGKRGPSPQYCANGCKTRAFEARRERRRTAAALGLLSKAGPIEHGIWSGLGDPPTDRQPNN